VAGLPDLEYKLPAILDELDLEILPAFLDESDLGILLDSRLEMLQFPLFLLILM
ncbi:hypothetical protein RclHR1_16550001, partial [Rhizophagus clarus]